MSLWQDFLTNDERIIHKWKHYFPICERHFGKFVHQDVVMLEIGCGQGGSLQMWKRFLGPHARIVGIDINPLCESFSEDQIDVRPMIFERHEAANIVALKCGAWKNLSFVNQV